jgi:hypothetical protein
MTFRDVVPRTANLTLASIPSGLTVDLDNQPQVTPLTQLGVVGSLRNLEAPAEESAGGEWYQFVSWSDGGARAHDIATPAVDTTYTVTYALDPAPTVSASAFAFDGATLPDAPHRLTFTFSEDVSASLDTGDLQLVNTATGSTVPTAKMSLAWNAATRTATFTFPGYANGILPDGNYVATLHAAGVTDPPGQPLPADAVVSFFVLAGDANRDRAVNLLDFNILASNFGQSGRLFSQGDFTYDGTVDLLDFNVLSTKFGQSVGPPAFGTGRFGDATMNQRLITRELLNEMVP